MKKALIIEDSRSIILSLISTLKQFISVECYFAVSAEGALELLNEEPFDVITLDGFLSAGHGRDILKQMSLEQMNKTIIYSSDDAFVKECKEMGLSAINKRADIHEAMKQALIEKNLI